MTSNFASTLQDSNGVDQYLKEIVLCVKSLNDPAVMSILRDEVKYLSDRKKEEDVSISKRLNPITDDKSKKKAREIVIKLSGLTYPQLRQLDRILATELDSV